MKILDFPIVRITAWLIIGILSANYLNIHYFPATICLSTALLFFIFTYFKTLKKNKNQQWFGITLYLLFFSIGLNLIAFHNPSLKKNHFSQNQLNYGTTHHFSVVISEKLKSTEKYNRYITDLQKIDNQIHNGKILLNIRKDSNKTNLTIGSKLQIKDQLAENFKPNNPDQFDYGNYLKNKGIYGQIHTESSQIKISSITVKNLRYYAAFFRDRIIKKLSNSGFKKEELAMITALILGQQQDINQDILRDYQYAGAVHILSVSGLHVGFILLFITFILKPLPNTNKANLIRITLTLVSLWLFAIVAGLSPSVIRSATMFSFMAIGKSIDRQSNTLHTTIASLFLILLIEPLFLFDIGFQLSYLAVLFILWLQPVLQNIWTPKNIVLKYFWDIITVSFAAQIGTLPLSIYYFHQFPGLFFITNLILIPLLGFVIMPLGTLLIICTSFNWVPSYLAKLVEITIKIMNQFINWIASLEGFIWKEIPLNNSILLLSYIVILAWFIWFQKPNFRKLAFALGSILLLQTAYTFTQWKEENKTGFIVFNAKGKSIIAERKGKKIKLMCNDAILRDSFEQKILQTYATANFCTLTIPKPIPNCLYFNNQKILFVDQSGTYKISEKADVIILSNSPKINLERLFTLYKPKIVIADGSNYKTHIDVWKVICAKNKIPFHSTYEKGFYKL
ncbi:competence protein ComEC family protein [Flavobacterium amniphilum]|uniref:ComEC/Rec2 family competence protein n=1 Tax=Flavobacterium amniphilum TaxID=1834035 RepID=UPI00202A5AEA|nr:ComEC/Rec2 family competence protein [Flavobacterium amniphilum]MCL9806529.1 competence protein ComEC family protein [Flavobacterium amniphilum]